MRYTDEEITVHNKPKCYCMKENFLLTKGKPGIKIYGILDMHQYRICLHHKINKLQTGNGRQ